MDPPFTVPAVGPGPAWHGAGQRPSQGASHLHTSHVPSGEQGEPGEGVLLPSSRTQLVCLLLAEELGPRMTPWLLVLTAERLNLDVCRQTSRVSLEKLHKAP